MRKKSETVRLKVDQRVAGDERSAVCRGMKNNLAGRGALDANDGEFVTNFAAVTDFRVRKSIKLMSESWPGNVSACAKIGTENRSAKSAEARK